MVLGFRFFVLSMKSLANASDCSPSPIAPFFCSFALSFSRFFSLFTCAGEHRADEHGYKPRDSGTPLVQVGGAYEAVVDVHALPLNQQPREAAAEGRAIGPVHAPAVVLEDVILDLLRHRQHVGKDDVRITLEAVVVDGDDVILLREIVHDVLEVQLPCAGRAGEQQQCPAALISKFSEIHMPYRASFPTSYLYFN